MPGIGIGIGLLKSRAGESYGPELHVDANAVSDPNGNEADATTGWDFTGLAGTGANISRSQSVEKEVGGYAFELDCNDTPTVNARAQYSISGVTGGEVYQITGRWKHKGVGGSWGVYINGANQAYYIANTETEWRDLDLEVTAIGVTLNVQIREASGSNDGAIYLDNLSIKKKL